MLLVSVPQGLDSFLLIPKEGPRVKRQLHHVIPYVCECLTSLSKSLGSYLRRDEHTHDERPGTGVTSDYVQINGPRYLCLTKQCASDKKHVLFIVCPSFGVRFAIQLCSRVVDDLPHLVSIVDCCSPVIVFRFSFLGVLLIVDRLLKCDLLLPSSSPPPPLVPFSWCHSMQAIFVCFLHMPSPRHPTLQ